VSEAVVEVTDETFESEVLKSELPVAVDMWAPWCGPCRMVSPTIEELASENSGKLKTCKMNVDENQEAAARYGISAIPSVLFFKDGAEVQNLRMIGAQPKSEYQKAIDKLTGE